jgi:hypothetical protein
VFPVTIRLEAGRTTLSLSGFKNSSLRISPGGTGRIPFFFILLLLDDSPRFFDVMRAVIFPGETDPPLVVDPDTVIVKSQGPFLFMFGM